VSQRVILTTAAESERAALAEIRRSVVGRRAPVVAHGGTSARPHPTDRTDPTDPTDRSDPKEPHHTEPAAPSNRRQPDRTPERLAPGILFVDLPSSFHELASHLHDHPPLFIRHIQPVDREVALRGERADLDRLDEAALELAPRVDPSNAFSVQTRLTASLVPHCSAPPYTRFEVNERLAVALRAATGAPLNVREPDQVLSVMLTPANGYLGLSRVDENLSAWAGGAIRFAREPGQVSRSEFKLLEALRVFGLTLLSRGAALDLGAAPGGWTRLLRSAGLAVTAVDPGDLDPSVAADPGVRHVRATAQEYCCREGEFTIIVNDMRMDARDSARLMLDYAPCLAADGLAIMTLKLPQQSHEQVAHQAIGLLLPRYRLLGARQLYHNRSEITVALAHQDMPNQHNATKVTKTAQ
jgi:23S rRNA (cytidine2498-2'-O)-methyltransferase